MSKLHGFIVGDQVLFETDELAKRITKKAACIYVILEALNEVIFQPMTQMGVPSIDRHKRFTLTFDEVTKYARKLQREDVIYPALSSELPELLTSLDKEGTAVSVKRHDEALQLLTDHQQTIQESLSTYQRLNDQINEYIQRYNISKEKLLKV